jgi:hypothetical protein
MPLQVVDRLETVDVDEGENESPIRPAGPVDLPLEIDHAVVTSKRPGQVVNAGLRAVTGGLLPILRRPLTITRSLGSVAGCQRPLARREAAVRPFAIVGRAVASLGRSVASISRAVASLGRSVALADPQTFLVHVLPDPLF